MKNFQWVMFRGEKGGSVGGMVDKIFWCLEDGGETWKEGERGRRRVRECW